MVGKRERGIGAVNRLQSGQLILCAAAGVEDVGRFGVVDGDDLRAVALVVLPTDNHLHTAVAQEIVDALNGIGCWNRERTGSLVDVSGKKNRLESGAG